MEIIRSIRLACAWTRHGTPCDPIRASKRLWKVQSQKRSTTNARPLRNDPRFQKPLRGKAAVKRCWEIIADNLSKAGWSLGCVSAVDSNARTIFIADAHGGDGKS